MTISANWQSFSPSDQQEAIGFDAVKQQIAEARANPLKDVGPPTKEERDSNVDNINITKGGTSTSYTLRRLARDNPELLDKIESGELSVNQAAIQ